MTKQTATADFQNINQGYNRVFRPGKLTIGLVVPLERYDQGPVPTMKDQIARIQYAEALGFSAVWLRDVPFNVPSFGDAGQVFDPFVYLGALAVQTEQIALGVASIILPVRHPAHVSKAAASVDVLSGGRLLLGVASGDRPEEYPALNIPFHERGQRFRDSFEYIRAMSAPVPAVKNTFGYINTESPSSMDLLPKPTADQLPLLITGGSQQSPQWAAQQADGWMTYPRDISAQARAVQDWNHRTEQAGRGPQPVMQPLYLDLHNNPDAPPEPIHLGLRLGVKALIRYLMALEEIGVNHVALNLRFNQSDINTTLSLLAEQVLPHFTEQ